MLIFILEFNMRILSMRHFKILTGSTILNITILYKWTFKFVNNFIYIFHKYSSAVTSAVDEAMVIEICPTQTQKQGNSITENSRSLWYHSIFRNLGNILKEKTHYHLFKIGIVVEGRNSFVYRYVYNVINLWLVMKTLKSIFILIGKFASKVFEEYRLKVDFIPNQFVSLSFFLYICVYIFRTTVQIHKNIISIIKCILSIMLISSIYE